MITTYKTESELREGLNQHPEVADWLQYRHLNLCVDFLANFGADYLSFDFQERTLYFNVRRLNALHPSLTFSDCVVTFTTLDSVQVMAVKVSE